MKLEKNKLYIKLSNKEEFIIDKQSPEIEGILNVLINNKEVVIDEVKVSEESKFDIETFKTIIEDTVKEINKKLVLETEDYEKLLAEVRQDKTIDEYIAKYIIKKDE